MSKRTSTHLYFYGGTFSNWKAASFVWKGQLFNNSEAAMMWGKAKLHEEEDVAASIFKRQNPKDAKALGRSMSNFDYKLWDKYKEAIMVDILRAKFSQNKLMKTELLMTNNLILVEASPYDKIWGVGLSADNPLILDEGNWRGQNLLGKCLVEARRRIAAEPNTCYEGNINK